MSPGLREKEVASFSPVIGIRGSRIIRIERSPISVNKNEEAIMIPVVHAPVFKSIFISRSLYTAISAVKNISGITIYLPNRIIMSVIKESTADAPAESKGKTMAQRTPSTIPIRYLIHNFMILVYHSVNALQTVLYIDILQIWKKLF